ncbi:MAG: hypothetical protein K2Y33_05330 [Mycolicibacterium frederiksbergense]|nr:hypothetical protein [Mycolicibacterium frederiksbergense]
MSNFARLAEHWINWTQLSGTTDVSVSEADKDCLIRFKSADGSFFLRREGTWWVIDEVDDHGKRYADTTRFSTFELAEKYLIWTWGSVARSVLRAEQLGVRLNSLGMAPGVSVEPTDREYVVELHAATGVAILPLSGATIASHWMTLSIEEVEQMLEAGLG